MASGHYQASYWQEGRRHVADVTFRSKAEAQKYLDSISTDMHRGVWTNPSDGEITVRELSELWKSATPTKRATTWANDESSLRVHILPVLGETPIARVKPPHIHAMISKWSVKAAPRTVRRRYATLRAMFTFAVDCEWINRTPCRAVKLPKVTTTRRHTLNADDVAAIAAAMAP